MYDDDREKVDEVVLALLYLTLHDSYRAWKGFDWETLNRLYEKGWIDNPFPYFIPRWQRSICFVLYLNNSPLYSSGIAIGNAEGFTINVYVTITLLRSSAFSRRSRFSTFK